MFGKFSHPNTVTLAAFDEGALSPAFARRVERHLQYCPRCRHDWEAIRTAQITLENAPTVAAPDTLWMRIEAQLDAAPSDRSKSAETQKGETQTASYPTAIHWWKWQLRVTGLAVGLLAIGFALRPQPKPIPHENSEAKQIPSTQPNHTVASSVGWRVRRLAGKPNIATQTVAKVGRLGVGQSLTTDAHSRARVAVANIGQVEIAPNSQIRLVQTQSNQHRLALDRGELRAKVKAPPRLFFVDTPSAVAVDLGCAYTLNVNKKGDSRLRVTSGWVALAENGHETEVPAGAVCRSFKKGGIGLPVFLHAPSAFQSAVQQFDREPSNEQALKTLLDTARFQDTLTLWHLLWRVAPQKRDRVINRLLDYAAFPDEVTRDGIRRLDSKMMTAWKESMEFFWY